MDKPRIENAVREILYAIGEDPNREGLIETPARVARMYEEVFSGIALSNDEIAAMFNKYFEVDMNNDIVVVRDIPCFSYCEHHMALMYDMRISIGYLPTGKVLGLSKLARIADMVCRRLQLQERIGKDILYIVSKVTGTKNVAVYIEAEHSCMTARGIKKEGVKTSTLAKLGAFNDDSMKSEFFRLIGR
jgi:GTP cyclohydrolase I